MKGGKELLQLLVFILAKGFNDVAFNQVGVRRRFQIDEDSRCSLVILIPLFEIMRVIQGIFDIFKILL
ncbi:hypothetical protein D3C81_1491470 [compost metagenome]